MRVCKTCGALGGLHKSSCTRPDLGELGQPNAAVKEPGMQERDAVNHPPHYGGENDPYEAIKVIEAWGLGFHLGNTIKYIARSGKKGSLLEDLKKARWYLDRFIKKLEGKQ